MEPYKNLSGDSGVVAFEIRSDSIIIEFKDDGLYLYTYASAGKDNIEQMKRLADNGKGLCTFVTRHVRYNYTQKIP